MNDFIRFEIKAEAFRLSTGHLAPGKDMAANAGHSDEEEAERNSMWTAWCAQNNGMFNKFIQAAENVGVE